VSLKVVITDYPWDSIEVEREVLRGIADLVARQTRNPDEFLADAADCDGLLTTYAGPIGADVIARMPKCRIIARYGIGVDTIDLAAATEAGIIVTNNPSYCIEEVAETSMALLLACARKVVFFDREVRERRWELTAGKPIFRVAGSTLGLVGFGNIARQVAQRAVAFGMRVLYCDPFVAQGQFDAPGAKVGFPELLAAADFVSLHPPLTRESRHMLDDAAFALMKRSAYLINCARGPIVHTDALLRALDGKLIAGCALDTTDPEPLPDSHPLRGRANVILNPHAAFYSEQSMQGLQSGAPNEVRRVLSGEWPLHVVNSAVRGRSRAGL
jgi:D-3-phosphoglycerate dehydrogenase